ncbi:hypothetical protein MK338_03800, partial [Streptococcus vestibularis]|nr:hypothetical protein [Streptococcus vestibularis]
RNADKAFT